MESVSKTEVEEGLKNPEVDQDSNAVETNDPDLSNALTDVLNDQSNSRIFGVSTSNAESAGQSKKATSEVAANAQGSCSDSQSEPVTRVRWSRKQRERRARRFKKFDEDQMKQYNSWLEQGLAHQDAFTKVVGEYTPDLPKGPRPRKKLKKKKKRRERQAARFQMLDRSQRKVYFGLRDQGWSYPAALSKVLELSKGPSYQKAPDIPSEQDKSYDSDGLESDTASSESSGSPETVASVPPMESIFSRSIPPFDRQGSVSSAQPSILPGHKVISHPILGRISYPSSMHNTSSASCGSSVTAADDLSLKPKYHSPPSGTSNLITPRQSTAQLSSSAPAVAVAGPPSCPQRKEFHNDPRVPKRIRLGEELIAGPHTSGTPQRLRQDPSSPDDTLHLCIVPSRYPWERFSEEQMNGIENRILDAVLEIDDESMRPTFNGSFHNNGRYEVVCRDQFAKEWIYKYARCVLWPDLKIVPAGSIKIPANAVLPLCQNDDNDKILKFIAKQNAGLNVGQWEVVQRRDSGWNTSLALLVDEGSAKVLKSCGEISFKLGTADIDVVDDPGAAQQQWQT